MGSAAARPESRARAQYSPTAAPSVVAEPQFTVGETNTIYWHPIPSQAWHDYADDKDAYKVVATDVSSGAQSSVTVNIGQSTTSNPPPTYSARFPRSALPGSPASVDGRTYRYVVFAEVKPCTLMVAAPGAPNCSQYGSWHAGPPSSPVPSTQDTTPPIAQSLTLADGATYTATLRVAVHVGAQDPGAHASGLGAIQLATSSAFPCPRAAVCAVPYVADSLVTLAAGSDGPRTVYARVFDAAQAPGNGASIGRAPGSFGLPPGNASAAISDSILLDTTGPKIVVTRTPEPQKAGKPVTFDGSQSVDQGGFNADSGVDAGTAVWDFGDGTKASGLAVSHVYATAGNYTATLSLKDKVGNQSTLAVKVTIMPSDWGGTGTPTQLSGTPTSSPQQQVDTTAPTLSGVRARRVRGRLRLTLSLSEEATLIVQMERLRPRPRAIVAARSPTRAAGLNTLILAAVRPRARYRVLIAARDAAGNVSPTRTLFVSGPRR